MLLRCAFVCWFRRFHGSWAHGLCDGFLSEPSSARPVLVHLGERCAQHADGRLPGWEDLHHAAAALELAVGPLLHVVGAKAPVVGIGEVEVDEGAHLDFHQEIRCFGAYSRNLVAGEMVELADKVGVTFAEDGMENGERGRPLLASRCQGCRVPHQMHDAALPCGSREDLPRWRGAGPHGHPT